MFAPLLLAAALAAGPADCAPREALLSGIGRARVVAFSGPLFGDRVCALVANLSVGSFEARITGAPAGDALLTLPLGAAGGPRVLDGGELALAEPYVVAPGGAIPDFGSDTAAARRVVLAYAGARLLVIATSPVALADLARVLRAQPDLFGASDAVERAALVASGDAAALALRTDDGGWESGTPASARFLQLFKR